MNKNTLEKVSEIIKQSKNPIIFSHVFPDPDAIGSAVGLALGLKKIGINAKAFVEVIPRMKKMIPSDVLVKEVNLAQHDLIIVVDTANKQRVAAPEFNLKTVNIDHHESNDAWGDFNYIDSKAPSSSVIVEQLLARLKLSNLGEDIANLLLAGLVDDTGSFRFSNATAYAFNSAAKLLEAGASPAFIANELYYSQKASRIKLQSIALQDLRFFLNGRVSLLSLSQQVLDQCGADADDTDGLVDIARSIEGVEIAVFIRENKGKWKASLRSKNENISVNNIAAKFDGGGHPAAAGCTLIGEISEVETRIVQAIKQELKL